MRTESITNWNKFPKQDVLISDPSFVEDVIELVNSSENLIARGNGRCYGDASLSKNVVSTLKLNKILSFDKESGIIKVQSGVLLSDIIDVCMHEGWFLPVTPGTKFITIGGAIASNVHGKNHHKEGAFGQHVLSIDLLLSNGEIKTITPEKNLSLFNLTCGGMGLTGVSLNATIQLKKVKSTYIDLTSIKTKNLEETMDVFEKNMDYTYSMAWIDTLQKGKNIGRSVVMFGEHSETYERAEKRSKQKTIPFNFPNWVLNRVTIKAFNFLYYHKQIKKIVHKIISYDPFFYPLDSIIEWNRMYGKRGFVQYQLVLPISNSKSGLREILEVVAKSKFESFLSVLKLMGKEDNPISFPMEGYTLAMDLPIKKGLFDFLKILDGIVEKHNGRLYLSKDARMNSKFFIKSHPAWVSVKSELRKIDPNLKFNSSLNERLDLK